MIESLVATRSLTVHATLGIIAVDENLFAFKLTRRVEVAPTRGDFTPVLPNSRLAAQDDVEVQGLIDRANLERLKAGLGYRTTSLPDLGPKPFDRLNADQGLAAAIAASAGRTNERLDFTDLSCI